jgi:DNA-binding transcriptional LysR family regulator
MDLKQLRQVTVLAETLNFRSAAERMHMAQPPLSVSIRRLEEELGVRLFDRSRAGVKLTPAGKSVLEHARRTLFHADQFRQAASLAGGGHVGTLRVEYVASSTIRLLPRAIARFRHRFPGVELHLSEANTDAIMLALHNGRSDVGIVRYPTPNHPVVAVTVLERNRYVMALPLGHPKASRARLQLADFRDEPFIFPSQAEGSAAYMSTLLACQRAGFMPRIVQQAAHAQSIMALVEGGLGVALVPDIWANLAPRAVAFKQLAGMQQEVTGLAFACRREEEQAALVANFRASVLAALAQPQPAGRKPRRR